MLEDSPRSFEMERTYFVNLFPPMHLSQNLRELVPHLPLFGIGYLNGLLVTQFTVLASMAEAKDVVANLSSISQDADDDDSTFSSVGYSQSAKKQLLFSDNNNSPTAVNAQTTADNSKISGQISEDEAMKQLNDEETDDMVGTGEPKKKGNTSDLDETEDVDEQDDQQCSDLINKLGMETPTK